MKKIQKGVALIEFALVLPFLIVLSVMTIELGRALYQYNIIAKAVRDGSRFLSTQDPTIAVTDRPKVDIAKNLIVYGNPNPSYTAVPLAEGLTLQMVSEPDWNLVGTPMGVINTVTIQVFGCASSAPPDCYKFKSMFASVFGLAFGEFNYANIGATMRAPL